ncbi:MAG: DNA-processing protein DprA, partial [Acidobacteriota bacterium]|nr:DNA-processing protein DprA [Acidobacteriota bacterium]
MSVNGSTPDEELVAAYVLDAVGTVRRRDKLALVRNLQNFQESIQRIPHTKADLDRAARRVTEIRRAGFHALCLTDPSYPRLLKAAPDPPFVLSIWGRLDPEDALGIAIVGARRATRYGLEMCERLSSDLSAAGLTIVSGLARGIDGAAHRGALEAGGRTIAVLGSGLSNLYPREHRRLASRIADHGAVISELDLSEPPNGRNFPRRNRIITGMTLGTLVVEAARKSGSLVSARIAMEQNRDVFAVPGPARAPNSEGVHDLIRDGAKLVTDANDVLDEMRSDVRELLSTRRTEP